MRLLTMGSIENEVLFAKTLKQPGVLQDFQMPRGSRLTVAGDANKIRNGQLTLATQREEPQTGWVGGSLQTL